MNFSRTQAYFMWFMWANSIFAALSRPTLTGKFYDHLSSAGYDWTQPASSTRALVAQGQRGIMLSQFAGTKFITAETMQALYSYSHAELKYMITQLVPFPQDMRIDVEAAYEEDSSLKILYTVQVASQFSADIIRIFLKNCSFDSDEIKQQYLHFLQQTVLPLIMQEMLSAFDQAWDHLDQHRQTTLQALMQQRSMALKNFTQQQDTIKKELHAMAHSALNNVGTRNKLIRVLSLPVQFRYVTEGVPFSREMAYRGVVFGVYGMSVAYELYRVFGKLIQSHSVANAYKAQLQRIEEQQKLLMHHPLTKDLALVERTDALFEENITKFYEQACSELEQYALDASLIYGDNLTPTTVVSDARMGKFLSTAKAVIREGMDYFIKRVRLFAERKMQMPL